MKYPGSSIRRFIEFFVAKGIQTVRYYDAPIGKDMGVIILCSIIVSILFGCCSKEAKEGDATRLFAEYAAFTDSISSLNSISADEIPTIIVRLKDIENKIFFKMEQDSSRNKMNLEAINCMSIYSSTILNRIYNAIDNQLVSFRQIIEIQERISRNNFSDIDSIADDASHFYNEVLKDSIIFEQHEIQYQEYLTYLEYNESKIPLSWEDLKTILYKEDILYRAYLDGLFFHSRNEHIAIAEHTEALMSSFSDYVSEHQTESEKVLVYLTTRTIHRQIQCAKRGIKAVKGGEVNSSEKAEMALTSFITPFMNYNPLLITLRTNQQSNELLHISDMIPVALSQLEKEGLLCLNASDSLPGQILKDFIAYNYFY